MRKIQWSDDALDDLDAAIDYVSRDSPRAGDLILDRIEVAINLLASMPTGHQGRVKGTYEKLVQKTSYIVAYALTDNAIRIVRIIHASRDWPEGEWPAE